MRKLSKKEINDLIVKAKQASKRARVHISNCFVGAAILTDKGTCVGSKIEFNSFSNTICAEKAAISNMMINGGYTPIAIAVYNSKVDPCFPCGMCRQALYEIGCEDMVVIACNDKDHYIETIDNLLPSIGENGDEHYVY